MKRLGNAALLALLAALLAAPFLVHPGLVFIAGFAMIQIVFVLSWNLLFSYAGLVSFGHAAFFGIGAYAAGAALRYGYNLHFLAVILIAAALGALAAFLIAIVVLRRASGIQFAVLTLALSQLVVTLIGYSRYLGHDEGLSGIPRPVMNFWLFALDLNKPLANYYFVFAVCLAATALIWLIAHGPHGRAMQAVRLDPERAEFAGIDIWRTRVLAFTLSGGFAAASGALLAPWAQIVTPDYVNWLYSAQPIFATLLGGAGSFWGPVAGVIGLSAINYFTRTFAGLSEVLVGASLLIVVLAAPQGILGFFQQIATQRKPGGPGSGRMILEARGIEMSYGALKVLRGVSLQAAEAETFAIIGPNGAGKTSLFKVLTGERLPSAGSVTFRGADVTAMPAFKRARLGFGRTFQVARIFNELSLKANIIVAIEQRLRTAGESPGPWWSWTPEAAASAEAEEILERFGFARAAFSGEAQHLSHGDRKRLELCMTLAMRPSILMLDEPTAGMSRSDRREMTKLLSRLKADACITIVMTEHDMDIIFELADRLMVLNYGEVIASGKPQDVRGDALVRKVYLGQSSAHA